MSQASIFTNFFWRFAEQCGAQLISFAVSILLARFLVPENYGTITIVTVFTSVLQIFIDSGLSMALIQKKNADNLDFSSVFYFNLIVSLLLYACMFLSAPFIANFYDNPVLTPLVRILSLTLVLSGLKYIQQTFVSKHMLFRKLFFSTLGGTLFSAILGIILAAVGFGTWALVAQYICSAAIDVLILWIIVPWRPLRAFSLMRIIALFNVGWKLLASALLDNTYNNMRNLLIGKFYSPADLAFYNQGSKIPCAIVDNINTSINSTLLPSLTSVQENQVDIKRITQRAIITSIYIMAPFMIGLFVCAESIVHFVLTDRWLPCVPYLRIFCIICLLYPIHTANLNAIKATGRNDLILRLEIIKKIIGLILLLVTIKISAIAAAFSLIISSAISLYFNCSPNTQLLNYSFQEQLKDMLPSILLAIGMGSCISIVSFLDLSDFSTLLIQVILGISIYLIGSVFFKLEPYEYLVTILAKICRLSS